mmetsp:Transcript_32796/g.33121  ORF Transcript_32796/g.33121 Transcript_32796/m.33121 type:complete len:87 (+) Transcript_32796:325-585(+)
MKTPFDLSYPFESFVKKIEGGVLLVDARSTPFTSNQLVQIAYTIIFNTNVSPNKNKLFVKIRLMKRHGLTSKPSLVSPIKTSSKHK